MARIKHTLENIHGALVRQNHDGFWALEDIAAVTGYSTGTVTNRIMKQKGFPAPVMIKGTGGKRWSVKQVRAWLDNNSFEIKK